MHVFFESSSIDAEKSWVMMSGKEGRAQVLPTDEEVGGMWMQDTFDLEKWVFLNSP